jgi:hypothetical protein
MSRIQRFIACSIVFLVCGLLYWPHAFSRLAVYDDEGYVMMSIRTFLDGHALYKDTFTQYGPFFYQLSQIIHDTLDWPLSHDGVRLKTVLVVATSLALAFYLLQQRGLISLPEKLDDRYRAWKISTVAGIGVILLFSHLSKLGLEPGHPQEFVLLLVMLWLFTSTQLCSLRHRSSSFETAAYGIFLGMIVGCMLMVKLNCGILLAIPTLLVGKLQTRRSESSKWLVGMLVIVTLSTIAAGSLSSLATTTWTVSLLLSAIAILAISASDPSCSCRLKQNQESWLSHSYLLVSVGLGASSIVSYSIFSLYTQGLTIGEISYGLVGQHRNLTKEFFQGVQAPWMFLILSFAANVYSIGVWKSYFAPSWLGPLRRVFEVGLISAFCIGFSSDAQHGLERLPATLVLATLGPSYLILSRVTWILEDRQKHIVCDSHMMLAILFPMIAYPVAGTQLEIGTIPMLMAITMAWIAEIQPYQFARSVQVKLFAVMVGAWFMTSGLIWSQYLHHPPLDLAGAHWLRIDAVQADHEREMTGKLLEVSRSSYPVSNKIVFLGHTSNRYYFWTGLQPLTASNPTFWNRLIGSSHENAILKALEETPRTCVVTFEESEKLVGNKTPRTIKWIRQHSVDFRWRENIWITHRERANPRSELLDDMR